MEGVSTLGIIAGNGIYPQLVATAAKSKKVTRISVAAFENETDPQIAEMADEIEWMRVGQLGRLLKFFQRTGVQNAIMAGQIAPGNLFDLQPDFRALLLLSKLKRRNAETLFGAVADELQKGGVQLLPATTFLEESLAAPGLIAGPKLKKRALEDIRFGFGIAKEVSRLDIGQTVVVRNGTVLAVEAFEGTNETIQRGAILGKGGAVVVKVSKPKQDLRFDVPVIGLQTLESAAGAGVRVIAVEVGKTLLLDLPKIVQKATENSVSIYGVGE